MRDKIDALGFYLFSLALAMFAVWLIVILGGLAWMTVDCIANTNSRFC